jgi:hypothetical protein
MTLSIRCLRSGMASSERVENLSVEKGAQRVAVARAVCSRVFISRVCDILVSVTVYVGNLQC